MKNWKSSVKQESTKQEIVAKTETAKFESLKNQLDPHFLFNSLNVLTSLIGENPKQAERFTTKLSKVYRYVLEQRNKDLVPIEEELKFAKTYMELLGMRFEEAVQFNIPDAISNNELKIVPLSLQLLLENAVKHNVVSTSKPLTINIYEEGRYLIIANNVNPKQAIGKSTKVGLQNIADRYGLITDKVVKIENNNKLFRVSLPLLIKMNNMMYTDDLENSKYVKALEKVEKLKEFYQNLASYCLVIPFLIFINLRFSPGFQWFWFPMFGWGIGLTFHFLEVNNYNVFLGKNWEDRKIKEMMKEDKNYK
jgi:two-component system LytT family sensor kinase